MGSRLRAVGALVVAIAMAIASAAPNATAQGNAKKKQKISFGFEDVAKRAEKLARSPYKDPRGQVPDWLLQISYDQWRDIRFKPEASMWRGKNSNFEVQFFHAGLFYDRTVKIHEVDAQGVRDFPFNPNQFDYGKNDFASRVPQDLGYAGFRVHYPIKQAGYKDEVIVFVGASYFRAVAKDLHYGLSARGIAIDSNAACRAAALAVARSSDPRAELRDLSIQARAPADPVEKAEAWAEDVRYLKLRGLAADTATRVEEQVGIWLHEKCSGVILDLRDAGGDDLEAADRLTAL